MANYPPQNYSDLCSIVADWLNRQDLTLQIPAFIALFESEYNDDPRARINDSVVVSTAPVANQWIPVPSDYIQMVSLRNPGSLAVPGGLQYLTPTQFNEFGARYQIANEPRYYSIVGKQLMFLPTPDQQYTLEMQYMAKVPPLSQAVGGTNWLFNDHWQLYLYGTLKQAEPYLKNDERLAIWNALYEKNMENLDVTDQRAQASGGVLKMRARSFG